MTESLFPPRSTSQRNAKCLVSERRIALEAEPNQSDQVRELATLPTARKQAMDCVSVEWSPCTAAEDELIINLKLQDFEGDLIDWKTDLEAALALLLRLLSPSLARSGL